MKSKLIPLKAMAVMAIGYSVFGVSLPAYASNKVALCNSCSDYQMKSQAIRTAPEGGNVHVVDMTGNRVKAFNIEREQNLVIVEDGIVDRVVEEGVEEARQTVDVIKSLTDGGIDFKRIESYLRNSNADSAYPVAKSARLRHDVADAIANMLLDSVAGSLTTAVGALGIQVVNAVLPVSIEIPVTFPDGTTYSFIFKGIYIRTNGDKSLNIQPRAGSGRDTTLTIPDSANYEFYQGQGEPDAVARTIDWMRLNGIEVTSVPGGTSMQCSFSGTTLLCRAAK